MDLEEIFYVLSAIFAFAAIVYFAWEYIEVLPRITKVILLFALAVLFLLVADVLRTGERAPAAGPKTRRKVSA